MTKSLLRLTLLNLIISSISLHPHVAVYLHNNTPFKLNITFETTIPENNWQDVHDRLHPYEKIALNLYTINDENLDLDATYTVRALISIDGSPSESPVLYTRLVSMPGKNNSVFYRASPDIIWHQDELSHSRIFKIDDQTFSLHYTKRQNNDKTKITYTLTHLWTAQENKPNSLSVLAWNIFMFPAWTFNHGQQARTDRIPRIIDPNYDVLVFSEAFDNRLRIQLIQALQKNGYLYHTDVVGTHDGYPLKINGGVFIMSKWPIIESGECCFSHPLCLNIDQVAAKGVVYAKIVKHDRPYHIFGTHTHAWTTACAIPVRLQQLQSMYEMIEQLNIPETEPIIIAGDLNVDMQHHTAEYQTMLNILHAQHPAIIGHDFTFDHAVNAMTKDPVKEFLDYVLYCKGHLQPTQSFNRVQPMKAIKSWDKHLGCDLSDHCAVYGYFEFDE